MKLTIAAAMILVLGPMQAFAGGEIILSGSGSANNCDSNSGGAWGYTTNLQAPNSTLDLKLPNANLTANGPTGTGNLPIGGYINVTMHRAQTSLQPTRIHGANTEWITIVPETWPVESYCDWTWVNTETVGLDKSYFLLVPVTVGGTRYELRYYEQVTESGVTKWLLSRRSMLLSPDGGVTAAPMQ